MRTFVFGSVFTAMFVLILTGGASAPAMEKRISVISPSASTTATAATSTSSTSTPAHGVDAPMAPATPNQNNNGVKQHGSQTKVKTFLLPVENFKLSLSVPEEQFNDYITGFTRCGFSKTVYEGCSITSTDWAYGIVIGSIRDGWQPILNLFVIDAQVEEVAPVKTFFVKKTNMTLFVAPNSFKHKIASIYSLDGAWERGDKQGVLFVHPYTKQTVVMIPSDEVTMAELERMVRGIVFEK